MLKKCFVDSLEQYKKDISKYAPITEKEARNLQRQYKNNGDQEAKKRLFEGNLQLVFNIATKYNIEGVDTLDVIQEGNIALMKAIEKYDLSRDLAFTYWVSILINQSIMDYYYRQSRGIRIPQHLWTQYDKIKQASKNIEELKGREPSINEIQKITSLSEQEIKRLYPFIGNSKKTNNKTIEELIDSTLCYEERYDPALLPENILENLILLMDKAALSEREINALLYKYGIMDGVYHSNVQTAKMMKISAERYNQIEEKTINKIRRVITNDDIEYFDYMKESPKLVNDAKATIFYKKDGTVGKNWYQERNIYSFFREFTPGLIDEMIEYLSIDEIDLYTRVLSSKKSRAKEDIIKFYTKLAPKMKEILVSLTNEKGRFTDEEIIHLGSKKIISCIDNLTTEEIAILTVKYSYDDQISRTNDEVASLLKISEQIVDETDKKFKRLLSKQPHEIKRVKTN